MTEQCNSCGGSCRKGGCEQSLVYPHNWAGEHMAKAEKELRESVRRGILNGNRADIAVADADALFNMRLKWK